MKLYCVRHGEAQSELGPDNERALSDNGVLQVTKVAEFLAQRDLHVSHIMHSCKLRAKQTADIFANALTVVQQTPCETLLNPESEVQPLVDAVSTWHEDTMIVGHLPFIAKLVSALVLQDETLFPIVSYPPGTVVCLDYYDGGRWIINWLLRPDMVC